ncbi:MAG: phosphoribosylglycinamide formyltransferase [Ruminococcaceae bacterium]|nr:phosphoribosylglycinamide formyltransferase [Oscillospiraceae bacterium]
MKTAVLVSGGGTNLQALIDSIDRGDVQSAEIVCVIANKENAYALERARKAGIPAKAITADFEAGALAFMQECGAELVVLAGFLSIIGKGILSAYKNRIINIHPSLIPSFCGKGYYGLHVHEKVLEYGVKLTGATVHFVSEEVDGGVIIAQKAVEVRHDDTPEVLQKRVMEEAEWVILPRAVELVASGRVQIQGRMAVITE